MTPPIHMPMHRITHPTLGLTLFPFIKPSSCLLLLVISSCIRIHNGMDVAMELEDDLFFADLSKQISLLIMDEDEEDPLACYPPESLQAFSGAIIHPPPVSVVVYEQGVRRESKGTGVFIPQSTQPRRRHRRGRSGSYAKHQKQSEDTRIVSQVPNNYSFRSRNG